jgi:hypothetical protein
MKSILAQSATHKVEKRAVFQNLEDPLLLILKTLDIISSKVSTMKLLDIDFPELDSCSECGNDILMSPLKAFSYLTCRHIFHRLCINKKLFIGTSSTYPALDCGKSVDILDQADDHAIISNLPIPDPRVTSQSTGISPLPELMGRFALSSPPIRMGGIKSTTTQQLRNTLRCAKCSEDLSLYLPPLGFL